MTRRVLIVAPPLWCSAMSTEYEIDPFSTHLCDWKSVFVSMANASSGSAA